MGRGFSRDDAEGLTVLAALGGGDVFFIFRLAFDATDGEGRGTQTIARNKATAHLADTVSLGVNGAKGVINGVESGVLLVGTAKIGGAGEGVGAVFLNVLLVGTAQSVGTGGIELFEDGRAVGQQTLAKLGKGDIAKMRLIILGKTRVRRDGFLS